MFIFANVKKTLTVIFAVCVYSRADITVQTQQGLLRGKTLTSSRSNRTFYGFMGIPYAKPPIGELRFKSPQSPSSWTGIRDATIEGSICPQINEFTREFEGEEDCLFLNVFTKQLPTGINCTLTPVMVSIHGGAFLFGSGNREIQGPDFLVDKDVVVVTFNYRLGLLGFLSLKTPTVPGNNGMKDQVMALRWVQQNIAQFGGDPGSVTIFGNSAGGASTHLHMFSPMSVGLFHRVISQSGSAFAPWAYNTPEDNFIVGVKAGEILGINTSSPDIMWQQLRNLSLQQIIPVIRMGQQFYPTVDAMSEQGQIFLPDTPKNIMRAGQIHNVPFITGITSNEGIVLLRGLRMDPNKYLFRMFYGELGGVANSSLQEEITAKVNQFYFGNPSSSNATMQERISVLTDTLFANGMYCACKVHGEMTNYSSAYMYEFSFSGFMSVFKTLIYGGEHFQGASHADDIAYIYRTSFHNRSFTPDSPEYITSERLVKMWTNFAKTGNPTPEVEPLLQNITWTPNTPSRFTYLRIGDDLTIQQELRNGTYRFWEEVYQNYTSHSLCG